MRNEVERLISTGINSLLKLELALFFQQHPGVVDRVEGIAQRVQRDARTVEEALCALADCGVIERFQLGNGKYVLYSYTRDPQLRALLDDLSSAYHEDPAARVRIVKRLMGLEQEEP